MIPDEDAAVAHFEQIRWGTRPTCPRCQTDDKITDCSRSYYRWCGQCRQYFTAKVGTVMEASKIPMRTWLLAIYYLVTARKSVSSLQLSKELSVSQPTAWFLLYRLREACGPDLSVLAGEVELDETYMGGKNRNKHKKDKLKSGTGMIGKHPVFGLRERGGPTVAMPVDQADQATIIPEIQRTVQPGSVVFTDDSGLYIATWGAQGFPIRP